jgi:hypothetical protein
MTGDESGTGNSLLFKHSGLSRILGPEILLVLLFPSGHTTTDGLVGS